MLTGATFTAGGTINLTWTHGGGDFWRPDYVAFPANYLVPINWQMEHRLKGAGSWRLRKKVSEGMLKRTASVALPAAEAYPDGALVEVRIQAEGGYRGGPWSNIRTITYRNDDLAALAFTGQVVTVRAGATATYGVKLTRPYGGVVAVTSDDPAMATVSPPSLTFTTATFNTAQTVTVTGVAQGATALRHAFRLTGAHTDAVPDAGTVGLTVQAPASVRPTGRRITLTSNQTNNSVSEGDYGSKDVVVTATLSEPAPTDLSLTVAGGVGSTAQFSNRSGDSCDTPLNPADTDWCLPDGVTVPIAKGETRGTQTVRIFSDRRHEEDETIQLTGYANAGGGDWISGALTLTVTDDDLPPKVTVLPTVFTIPEGGSGAYTVKLDSAPPGNVTVVPYSGDPGAADVSPSSLTFTTGNWGTAQTVTVTGEQDPDADNESVTVSHAVSGYGDVGSAAAVTVNVADDDLVVSASGSNGRITATWTYNGSFRSGWKWQWQWFIHPQGGASFGDIPAGSGTAATRTASFAPPNANARYAVKVRLVERKGRADRRIQLDPGHGEGNQRPDPRLRPPPDGARRVRGDGGGVLPHPGEFSMPAPSTWKRARGKLP